jgi:hypothetical protein
MTTWVGLLPIAGAATRGAIIPEPPLWSRIDLRPFPNVA